MAYGSVGKSGLPRRYGKPNFATLPAGSPRKRTLTSAANGYEKLTMGRYGQHNFATQSPGPLRNGPVLPEGQR